MNIYVIRSRQGKDWDSYDGHVVIAKSEAGARSMVPYGDEAGGFTDERGRTDRAEWWGKNKNATCELIGVTTMDNVEEQVVLSSHTGA